MEIVTADEIGTLSEGYAGRTRSGNIDRQWFFRRSESDGLNFRFFRSIYKGGDLAFESPRHHHNFQQFRWTEMGSVNFGPGQDIAEGDIAYFPRGTYYGPQRKHEGVGILLQFGFGDEMPSRRKPEADEDTDEARIQEERWRARGGTETMEAAASVEAAPATATVPPERFSAPILMHPAAFQFHELGVGVAAKWLGRFHDHDGEHGDVAVIVLRLSEGGEYRLASDRAQLGWTITAGLEVEGQSYPRMTSFFSPRGDEAALRGSGGTEMIIIEFPRLD